MHKNEEYFVCRSEGIYWGKRFDLNQKISCEEFEKFVIKSAKDNCDVCIPGGWKAKLLWEDIENLSEDEDAFISCWASTLISSFSYHSALSSVLETEESQPIKMHTFESGAVRDIQEGKGRMDLVPLDVVCDLFSRCDYSDFVMASTYKELSFMEKFKDTRDTAYLYLALMNFCRELYISPVTMVLEVSKHFEDSLVKYKENNWKLGIPVNSFINSASRHYLKWLRGDTDEKHDLAFVWNLMCCISTVNSSPTDVREEKYDEESN